MQILQAKKNILRFYKQMGIRIKTVTKSAIAGVNQRKCCNYCVILKMNSNKQDTITLKQD